MQLEQTKILNQYQSKETKDFPLQIITLLSQLLFTSQLHTLDDKTIHKLNKYLRHMRLYDCIINMKELVKSKNKFNVFLSNIHDTLRICLDCKIDSILLKACVNIVKEFRRDNDKNIKIQKIKELAKRIDYHDLGYYCQAFQIQIQRKFLEEAIKLLANKKDYFSAFKLISAHPRDKQLIKIVANEAKFSKDLGQLNEVIQQVVKLGFGKEDFLQLHQQGLRLKMRQIYNQNGYECAEEVFGFNSKLLAMVVERMLVDKRLKKRQILSVCLRNPDVTKFLHNKITPYEVEAFNDVQDNKLQTNIFGPSDSDRYFTLQELGIRQKDIVFINSSTPNLEKYLEEIVSSDELGLDTQSYVARTKFNTELELIATIQISNSKMVYIFDAKDIKNPKIGEKLCQFFLHKNKTLVGHTLLADLSVTLQALGITKPYECKCIDVKFDFKRMFPGVKAGLKSISEHVLGKPICKQYTLTNWGRRPLLLNQLHYAALDAVIVLHIYHEMEELKRERKYIEKN